MDLAFVGSNALAPTPYIWDPVPQHYNFYEQNTPQGVLGVTGGKRVIYENIYPNIDLHLYSNKWGPKMYIVVRPNGNPSNIKIQWSGHDSLKVDVDDYLKVWFGGKFLKLTQGMAYQQQGNTIVSVPWMANYVTTVGSPTVGFTFGTYNPLLPLILMVRPFNPDQLPLGGGQPIPPEWCTFMAGASDDAINDLTHDADGNLYFTGQSRSTSGLPITQGVFQGANLGASDVVIGRVNEFYEIDEAPAFDTWMTYLGGNAADGGVAIEYDGVNDRLVVAGELYSDVATRPNFDYIGNPDSYQRLPQSSHGGFVSFVDPENGTRTYLTRVPGDYIGGWNIDTDTDADGNTYVVGAGLLMNSSLIYEMSHSMAGAYSQFNWVETDLLYQSGFVLRLTPNANVDWFSRIGGPRDEFVHACKVDGANKKFYLVGRTLTPNDLGNEDDCDPQAYQVEFPLCNAGGYFQTGCNGAINTYARGEGFIQRFDLSGAPVLDWSTYFGGAWDESITDVAVDSEGRVYVTGYSGTNFYNVTGCEASNAESGFPWCHENSEYFTSLPQGASVKQFIARFETDTKLSWGTKIGDNSDAHDASPNCKLAIDPSDNVYVFGSSLYLSTGHVPPLPPTASANFYFDPVHTDNFAGGAADTYIGRFSPTGELSYSSYLGGVGSDYARGITAFDDRVYICGTSFSTIYFPTHAPEVGGHEPYLNEVPQSVLADGLGDGFIAQLRFDLAIGLEESGDTSAPALCLFPNPATDALFVQLPTGIGQGQLLVHDASGRLVLSRAFANTNRPELPTGSLAQGSYSLTLLCKGVPMGTARFAKY